MLRILFQKVFLTSLYRSNRLVAHLLSYDVVLLSFCFIGYVSFYISNRGENIVYIC